MGAGSTPAGWYPDVERPGGERYWNGASWTEDRRPALGSVPPGVPPVGGPTDVPHGYAAYGAQTPEYPGNALAGWGLGLSITGLVCCLFGFLCIPGAIMGWVHLQRIKRAERDPGSRGLALAAVIVGAIGTLVLIGIVFYVVAFGLAVNDAFDNTGLSLPLP